MGRGGGGEKSISDQSRFVDCVILVRSIHFYVVFARYSVERAQAVITALNRAGHEVWIEAAKIPFIGMCSTMETLHGIFEDGYVKLPAYEFCTVRADL